MTSYVLGVQPVDPGYATFTVTPHFGSLNWAKGAVPTPFGQILVSWAKRGGSHLLTVQAPAGTAGSIAVGGFHTTVKGGTVRTFLSR
jgi:hypothetical protein